MDSLKLDPGSYTGTYKLIGDEICLDFINSVSWQGTEKEHDWLDQPANFIAWALAVKIIDTRKANLLKARPAADLKKELDKVHALRSDLYKVLHPLGSGRKPAEESITRQNALILKISRHRYIDPKKHQWAWVEPSSLTQTLSPVIWNAAHIITDLNHARIKHCPGCDWIFYDRTRNGSRKWCDMEDCGSRDKSLRYYHRQKE